MEWIHLSVQVFSSSKHITYQPDASRQVSDHSREVLKIHYTSQPKKISIQNSLKCPVELSRIQNKL